MISSYTNLLSGLCTVALVMHCQAPLTVHRSAQIKNVWSIGKIVVIYPISGRYPSSIRRYLHHGTGIKNTTSIYVKN